MKTTFEEYKQQIIEKSKAAGACQEEFKRALRSKNYDQLFQVISDNIGWVANHKIITQLPDNLSVGGSLYLSNTQITQLPDNLSVGGSLDLSNTQITQLPDNLSVGYEIIGYTGKKRKKAK